jgi:hypothetical protein
MSSRRNDKHVRERGKVTHLQPALSVVPEQQQQPTTRTYRPTDSSSHVRSMPCTVLAGFNIQGLEAALHTTIKLHMSGSDAAVHNKYVYPLPRVFVAVGVIQWQTFLIHAIKSPWRIVLCGRSVDELIFFVVVVA